MAMDNAEVKWIHARISLLWGVVLLVIAGSLAGHPWGQHVLHFLAVVQIARALLPALGELWAAVATEGENRK